ncbi:MAG: hypothetical protein AAF681_13785 [Pseudomonadota bacterium]
MKKLALLFTLVPSVSLAHGNHAPMPEPVHSVSHAIPGLALILILAVLALVAYRRWMS